MDPAFVARLERQARANHGLPVNWTDQTSTSNPSGDHNESIIEIGVQDEDDHKNEDENEDEDENEGEEQDMDEEDEDQDLRAFGEVPAEVDDNNNSIVIPTTLDSTQLQQYHQNHLMENDQVEDDDDDATSDSEEENHPKKLISIPTIRLKLNLPTQLPLPTIEKSVSLLAKHAGYQLPADTAITFGASSVHESNLPPSNHAPAIDMPPPPKRRRRRRIQERDEGYDKDDPFVDDSEAFIMEPKYYYPPARDGFFAATGRLELKSDLNRKSKTRKPSLKNVSTDFSKLKRRVPLTTVPESASTGSKSQVQSSSISKTPVPQNESKDTHHQVSASPSSTLDSQIASQSKNVLKQADSKVFHAPRQATSQPKNIVQQFQSKVVSTNLQPDSKSPNTTTQQIENIGSNKDIQTNVSSQSTNAVLQTLADPSAPTQSSTCESKNLTDHSLAQTSNTHPQLIHQSQDPPQQVQFPITSHQLNSQLQNLTPHNLAETSQVHPSLSLVQQKQLQGFDTRHLTQVNNKSSGPVEIPQDPSTESNQFSKLDPISSPQPIQREITSNQAQPLPRNLTSSQLPTSQASPNPLAQSLHRFGTPLNPITLIDDDDQTSPHPARPQISHLNSSVPIASSPRSFDQSTQHHRPYYLKSRSLPERKTAGPLPSVLEQALEQLKVKIEAASPFVPKKFPPELKPYTLEVAEMALDLNEYDECFFIRLAQLFPYNTFTIKKLVKREILPRRKLYYEGQINQRIQRLREMIAEGMPSAREEYEQAMKEHRQAMLEYEKRQEARRSKQESSKALPANASTILSHTDTKSPFSVLNQESEEVPEKPPKQPSQSFKLTHPMREVLYELVKLEDEQCQTVKDTQKIVDKNVSLKDTSNRRQFYSKLAHLWPDDFMTSSRLSHIVGSMKKKYEGNSAVEPQNPITLS